MEVWIPMESALDLTIHVSPQEARLLIRAIDKAMSVGRGECLCGTNEGCPMHALLELREQLARALRP